MEGEEDALYQNESNISDCASSGVNAIVTTAMYFGKPSDIGVTMEKY